jgi:hypothetical protein
VAFAICFGLSSVTKICFQLSIVCYRADEDCLQHMESWAGIAWHGENELTSASMYLEWCTKAIKSSQN